MVLAATGKYFSAGFELARPPRRPGLHDARGLPPDLRETWPSSTSRPWPWWRARPSARAASWPRAATWSWPAQTAKFGHPEIKGGVFNTVAAVLLPRLVGRKRAFEMILGGDEPHRGGGRDASASSPGSCPTTSWRRRRPPSSSASRRRARRCCRSTRRAITGALDLPFADAVRHAEDVYLNQLMGTEDVEEGLRAVMEKRKPVWKDR